MPGTLDDVDVWLAQRIAKDAAMQTMLEGFAVAFGFMVRDINTRAMLFEMLGALLEYGIIDGIEAAERREIPKQLCGNQNVRDA